MAAVVAAGCPYPETRANHPVCVYLCSDKRYTTEKHLQEIVPYVGIAENPFDDIKRQNREAGYTGADHTTKQGAGFLKLELVIGMFCLRTAEEFKEEWRKSSRKLISRVQKGVLQAIRYRDEGRAQGIEIYCADPEWVESQMKAVS